MALPGELLVFAHAEFYKKDHDRIEEYYGKLEKCPILAVPAGGGTGPAVTDPHYYQLVSSGSVIVINSNKEHNRVLDSYINQEVKIIGKMRRNELLPGYLIPLHHRGHSPIFDVFADAEWYRQDKDKVEHFLGTLLKVDQLPPHGGHGPETILYKLRYEVGPQIPLQERAIYSHGITNDILDQNLNNKVKIIGKLHNDQIWPGYLSPVLETTSSASSSSKSTESTDIVEPIFVVFADEDWYRKDRDKIKQWTGRLEKYTPSSSGPGLGPQVTTFYQLAVARAPKLPVQNIGIYSHGQHNSVLDSHIGKEVAITGKHHLHDNQIWPGFLHVVLHAPGPSH